jgi:hypothetical protein
MDMYTNFLCSKRIDGMVIPFKYVLFDASYVQKKFIALISNSGHYFLTNMKANRLATELGVVPATLVQIIDLDWDRAGSLENGKVIILKDFPHGRELKTRIYQLKQNQLDEYYKNTILNPILKCKMIVKCNQFIVNFIC